jgi:hypothetical protein
LLTVVGSGGVVIQRDPGTGAWSDVMTGARTSDNRLFTVSCDHVDEQCWAVGGEGMGLVLRGNGNQLQPLTSIGAMQLDYLPGLNGVYMQDVRNVFIVGTAGFTMHTNGTVMYTPPTAATTATLHGVGGYGPLVIAVGGELSVSTPDQRGVILVRGDNARSFTFDGQVFMATGNLRMSLGGTGQGG